MGKMNWGRIVLCGLATGGLWMALLAPIFFLALRESEYMAAMRAARAHSRVEPILLATPLNLAAGVWIMWLYAAIRPRFGPGPKTASISAVAGWVAIAIIEVDLAVFRLLPISLAGLAVPLTITLPAMILAALVGASYYQE